jgi:hypothetical protein
MLVQVRGDEAAEAQERLCFLETAGLEPEEMDCINVVREPKVSWSRVESAERGPIPPPGSSTLQNRLAMSS